MKRRDLLILSAGAGITAALSAGAQQKAMPVIGYLSSTSPGSNAPWVEAFCQGLQENGYVEGQNVAIEYRWAEGRYDRLPRLGRRPRRQGQGLPVGSSVRALLRSSD